MNEIHHIDFEPVEREIYDAATSRTRALIKKAISSGAGGATYNALQRLNILRLICCHGRLARCQEEKMASGLQTTNRRDMPNQDIARSSTTCYHCGMEMLEVFFEGFPFDEIQAQGTMTDMAGQFVLTAVLN